MVATYDLASFLMPYFASVEYSDFVSFGRLVDWGISIVAVATAASKVCIASSNLRCVER